ncbi:MAG TPA: hypothetical protein VML94_03640 [Thermoplasmata archaeon]|nr:hypothetical protein [Thermoplasmata archaeon]
MDRTTCPVCSTEIAVDPEWRMVQCPSCHEMVLRMTDDATYD